MSDSVDCDRSSPADPSAPLVANRLPRRLMAALCLAAIAIGAIHAWMGRFSMNADGVCYLDMGEAWLRGDWPMAVNAHWSPLYACIVAAVLAAVKPSPYWEFPAVNCVNFGIYLGALGAFCFFISELVRFHRGHTSAPSTNRTTLLPEWALLTLGFALFVWCSLPLRLVSPDMAVAAIIYLACAMLLRIRRGAADRGAYAALGVILGIGYLFKAPMFPLAFVFLGCGLFVVFPLRRTAPRVFLATAVFLLISMPFVIALSKTKGRLTFGDSGGLNYAWMVDGVTEFVHWQGGPPGAGTPVHPTRKLLNIPAVYEFATPIKGTYPAWYDPSYWYEGVTPHFDLRGQIRALSASARDYFHFFYHWQGGLIAGVLALYLLGYRRSITRRCVLLNWFLFVPAVAGLAMYAVVFVSLRYVTPFMLVLWMAVLTGIRLPDRADLTRPVACICTAMVTMVAIALPVCMFRPESNTGPARNESRPVQWEIADALARLGVRPGAKVAFIGDSLTAYWARLARVRIVAEVPAIRGDADLFRAAYPLVKDRVIETLAKTPAEVIVAEGLPSSFASPGWRRVGSTDLFVYFLRR
jgi:hypothetical protein